MTLMMKKQTNPKVFAREASVQLLRRKVNKLVTAIGSLPDEVSDALARLDTLSVKELDMLEDHLVVLFTNELDNEGEPNSRGYLVDQLLGTLALLRIERSEP